jgi:hypothetical protein
MYFYPNANATMGFRTLSVEERNEEVEWNGVNSFL